MSQSFPINAIVFPDGDTLIPARNIPVGTNKAILTLDVSSINKSLNQSLLFTVEWNDTIQWTGAFADFNGPWLDKQGVLHNDSSLTISFGTKYVDGVPVPILSQANWQIRATIKAVNGPISSNGGSLVVS